MNDTQQSTACLCTTCPGASCGCGCQNVPSQAATQATTQAGCACGAQCQCGPSCSCAKS
jgi:hypothetical protein